MNERVGLIAILLLGLALRLYGLHLPLLDLYDWRQTATAMIARNFARNGYALLWPQVDWGGKGPGYLDCEFPIYQFVVSLLYLPFGIHEWLGRLVSALGSTGAAYFIYRIGRLHCNSTVGLGAAAFFAFSPVAIFFGHSFQPDSAMVLLSVASVFFFSRYAGGTSWPDLFLSSGSLALAAMIKPTILHLLLPLFYLWITRYGWRGLQRADGWLWLIGVIAPVIGWYWHARKLSEMTGLHFMSVGSFEWLYHFRGEWSVARFTNMAFRIVLLLATPVALLLSILAMFGHRSTSARFFQVWLVAVLLFILGLPHLNLLHHYYQLPLLPVLALIYGLALQQMRKATIIPLAALATFAGMTFAIAEVRTWYDCAWDKYAAARAVRDISSWNSLIVSVEKESEGSVLYYADRKGWHSFATTLQPGAIDRAIQEGARYLSIVPGDYAAYIPAETRRHLQQVAQAKITTSQYRIYEFLPASPANR